MVMVKRRYVAPKNVDQLASLFKQVNQHQTKQFIPKEEDNYTARQQGQT